VVYSCLAITNIAPLFLLVFLNVEFGSPTAVQLKSWIMDKSQTWILVFFFNVVQLPITTSGIKPSDNCAI